MSDDRTLDAILDDCAAGILPPPVAAMRLLMEADGPASAEAALLRVSQAPGGDAERRIRQVADLMARHPDAWRTVHAVLGAVEHGTADEDPVAHWARLFDEAVRRSPEGSVALYSLGSAELLAEATAEIVALLDGWTLLGPRRTVLDIGCGIGRLEAALAPLVGSIVGLDISRSMLSEARIRCAGLSNVSFILGSGRDLEMGDCTVDLVMIVDAFPYLMLSGEGLARRHLEEAARVLRPGGDLVILNASYRNDLAADVRDLTRFASATGLHLGRVDERPCGSWDAPAFQLVKR